MCMHSGAFLCIFLVYPKGHQHSDGLFYFYKRGADDDTVQKIA